MVIVYVWIPRGLVSTLWSSFYLSFISFVNYMLGILSFLAKWIFAQKLGIPKIQFIEHMKLKKKEDQSVDTLVLLRMGNKILMGGNTETTYRAETEGKTTQRLPHLGNHPIHNHQT